MAPLPTPNIVFLPQYQYIEIEELYCVLTWTTFTTKKRDKGSVAAMRRQEKTVSSCANTLGPSSQTAAAHYQIGEMSRSKYCVGLQGRLLKNVGRMFRINVGTSIRPHVAGQMICFIVAEISTKEISTILPRH